MKTYPFISIDSLFVLGFFVDFCLVWFGFWCFLVWFGFGFKGFFLFIKKKYIL